MEQIISYIDSEEVISIVDLESDIFQHQFNLLYVNTLTSDYINQSFDTVFECLSCLKGITDDTCFIHDGIISPTIDRQSLESYFLGKLKFNDFLKTLKID